MKHYVNFGESIQPTLWNTQHYITTINLADAAVEVSDHMIISVELNALEAIKGLHIRGFGERQEAYFVRVTDERKIYSCGIYTGKQLRSDGETVHFAVAVDSENNTYSLWLDRELLVDKRNVHFTLGKLKEVTVLRTGSVPGPILSLEDLDIYDSAEPVFVDKEKELPECPIRVSDEFFQEQMVGKPSPVLNYAEKARKQLDAAGAVALHKASCYVYANGKRTQQSQEAVDALLAGSTGKTVLEDPRGLVIISDKVIGLGEKEVNSLHNYLLYIRPLAQELKDLFQKRNMNIHPRVIIDPEKLNLLIAQYKSGQTYIKKWGDIIIALADKKLQEPLVTYVQENGRKTNAFRRIVDGALSLSLAYYFTGERKYVEYLWANLEAAGNFPEWNMSFQFLDTGEFIAGFGIAYDWLYDVWTQEQRQFLEAAILKHGLYYEHRYLYGQEPYADTFVTSPTNRNAVCNGGACLAALALFDKYPDKCADILEKAYHALEIMMDEFAPDGANTEGPGYWEYAIRYLSKFMVATEVVFGTDFNIYKTPGFATTGDFYLHTDGMTGTNNYHDGGGARANAPDLFWLSNIFDRPDITEVALYKAEKFGYGDTIRYAYALMYYNTDIAMPDDMRMPLDGYFRNMESVSMRSSWTDDEGVFVGMHTGRTHMSHAHMDSGTFVVDIGKQRFAGDPGAESYTILHRFPRNDCLNTYFLYRKSAEGHNLFVINPADRLGQSVLGNEAIQMVRSSEEKCFAIAPMKSYYNDGGHVQYAQDATRGMMLGDQRRSVLIRDEIRGMEKEENEVYWFMQMPKVEIDIAPDKKSAILHKGGVDVRLQVVSDNAKDFEITVTEAKELHPRVGLQGLEEQTVNKDWQRLAIIFKAGRDLNINVKMARLNDPIGDTPIVDVPLADWTL